MTDTTPNLALPEIASAQAQKHVTHNEALRVLDAIVHLAVLDRDLSAPPETPEEGQRWLVAAGASGAWSGKSDQVAAWQDGGWLFYVPSIGWLAYVIDEEALLAWSGTGWEPALDLVGGATELQNMALLGLGTTADSTNPFSAKLNNALWTARTDAEGGDGDLRYKMSKEGEANTLSVLFQTGFSGRAEIGLTGDDDFHFKVSDDGTTWRDAIVIDKGTGQVSFPQGGNSADLELTLAELSLGVADALNAAQVLGSSGNRFADSFDALTYVDTGAATNLNTGTAGQLKPTAAAGSQISTSGKTKSGTLTANGGVAAAMDGTTAQAVAASAFIATSNSGYNNTAAVDWGVGVTNVVARIEVWSPTDYQFMGAGATGLKLQGSNNGTDWTDLWTHTSGTGNGQTYDSNSAGVWVDQTTAYRHHRFNIQGNGGNGAGFAEIKFYGPGTINNLTVTSTALTAASAPATASLVARVKEVDAVTLNTDLIASASRDGGTTWSTFALTKKYTANAISVYESAVLDISGQPSGTAMKWRIATANNKMVELHGVYFSWS